jgi:hypothetical protein
VRFSVTIRVDKKVRTTIEAIPADAWVEIEYPQPVWDEAQQRFISRAHIAEIAYTAFENTPDEVTARLIVRRIPDLNNSTVDGQGEVFPVWRYHAAFTDSPFILIQAEPSTAATPSSSRSSPNSSTARWRTCRRAGSTPTMPG